MLSGHWRPDGHGGQAACGHGGMVLLLVAWWHGAGGHEALNWAPVCMQVALQDLQDRLVPL